MIENLLSGTYTEAELNCRKLSIIQEGVSRKLELNKEDKEKLISLLELPFMSSVKVSASRSGKLTLFSKELNLEVAHVQSSPLTSGTGLTIMDIQGKLSKRFSTNPTIDDFSYQKYLTSGRWYYTPEEVVQEFVPILTKARASKGYVTLPHNYQYVLRTVKGNKALDQMLEYLASTTEAKSSLEFAREQRFLEGIILQFLLSRGENLTALKKVIIALNLEAEVAINMILNVEHRYLSGGKLGFMKPASREGLNYQEYTQYVNSFESKIRNYVQGTLVEGESLDNLIKTFAKVVSREDMRRVAGIIIECVVTYIRADLNRIKEGTAMEHTLTAIANGSDYQAEDLMMGNNLTDAMGLSFILKDLLSVTNRSTSLVQSTIFS